MEDYTTILSSSLCLVLLVLVAFKLFKSRSTNPHKLKLPPSPLSLPMLGHLHLLMKSPLPLHQTLYKLSLKYGPIVSLRFGSHLVVSVTSSSLAEECFTKNDIVLANRPKLFMTQQLSYNCTTVSAAPYGDHWRNLRRIIQIEILSSSRLNSFLSIRREEIRRLVRQLWSRVSSGDGFVKVEMKSLFSELTFNIMTRMIAGKRFYGKDVEDEEESRRFRGIIKEALEYGGASNPGDFLPILNWLDNGSFEKRVLRLGRNTDGFMQGLIDEHRSKKEGLESMNTMIDHLLSLQAAQPEYYTDQIIKGLMLVMILAGTDTTAVTLEWAMSSLVNNTNVLKKAITELDTQIGQERLVEEQDVSKLHYLQNIISEAFRLNPAAPLLAPHYSSEDCTIGGYDMPRDTILLVNAWAIHRDPKLWDDPTSFKPERFEREGETNKLIPFGWGRRTCPGGPLSNRVLSLTLGSLIQCFEWKRVSEKEVDMTEGKGIITDKVVPLEVICKARPIMSKILPQTF